MMTWKTNGKPCDIYGPNLSDPGLNFSQSVTSYQLSSVSDATAFIEFAVAAKKFNVNVKKSC